MSDAALNPAGEGRWMLAGVLDFASVPQVWPRLEQLLQKDADLTISLADIKKVNSAGLVMLMEARDTARRNNCNLDLVDLPEGLLDLAGMSGCERIIVNNVG